MNYTELVEKAKLRDENAIEQLFEATSQKGYFVALKYLKNKEDARDILQDSYVTALSKLGQLKDTAKFDKWLFQIIANKAKNYLVKNKPLLFEQLESDDEDAIKFEDTINDDRIEFQPKENYDYQELKGALKILIDELPDDQRMCLLMYYFEELSINEIADSLELNMNTVKSRLNYARAKIKTKIEDLQKKGTHLYSISPIPFMLWLLRDEVKATIVPNTIISEISAQMAGEFSSAVGQQAILSETLKKGVLLKSKSITAKIILSVVIGSSVIAGGIYLANNMNDEKSSSIIEAPKDEALASVEEMSYAIEKEMPNFEERPIDIYGKGYLVKVDGKYGVLDKSGNWYIKNEYKDVFYYGQNSEANDQVCLIKEDGAKSTDNINLKALYETGVSSGCSNEGFGGYMPGIVTLYEENVNDVFYYNRETYEKTPFHELHYTTYTDTGKYDSADLLDSFGSNRTNILIINPLDKNNYPITDIYYTVTRQGQVSGPYKKNEGFSFGSIKNTIAYENTPLKGLFLQKNEDGYSIKNCYGSDGYPEIIKNAELISYDAVKITSGKYMGVIDDSFEVVLYGEFEDVTKPIDGNAIVKIDGNWQLINIKK